MSDDPERSGPAATSKLSPHQERERALVERYVRGYTEHPETAEELALSDQAIAEVFAEHPWEESDSEA
jgi:hypothetical protein